MNVLLHLSFTYNEINIQQMLFRSGFVGHVKSFDLACQIGVAGVKFDTCGL